MLGYTVKRMLAGLAKGDRSAADLLIAFPRFGDVAAIESMVFDMLPDSLAFATYRTISELCEYLRAGMPPQFWWSMLIADRFASLMSGVAERKQYVKASTGFLLRVMARCLDDECHVTGAGYLSERFWPMMACITWLELRHSGAEPAVERIVLALS